MAKKRQEDTITSQIISQFKDSTRAEIRKWRMAILMAEHYSDPKSWMLQDLYDNLKADGHLIAQINLRKAATLSYDFAIVDKKSGKMDDDKTGLLQTQWFYRLLDIMLDVPFFGYTLIELTDPATMNFSLIPRRNTIGRLGKVVIDTYNDNSIDISNGFDNTLLKVGEPDSLGLMMHLCGMLIWKRNAQQSWAEFSERFGMPLISATTTKSDEQSIARLNRMLRELGEAATAALPEGTTIQITPFTTGDSYQVYNQQIEQLNKEISKPITGGTMVTDDGSSRSQSEVHERNLDNKIAESDRRMVAFVINDQLLPMMHYWGWNINPDTDKFCFNDSFELSVKEHWDIVNSMLNRYVIDESWLAATFNVPIVKERDSSAMPGGLAGNFR